MGGGERGAHTVFDYWVPATAFPSSTQYVALGHLHRAQRLDGPAPLHYCGSPLQLDFGETANQPVVNLVDLRPGLPAEVRAVELTAGRRLRTLKGPLDQLREHAGTTGDDHLRLVLDEPSRIGLADEARELFPTAVEVVLAARDEDDPTRPTAHDASRLQRTPHDLLTDYLHEREAEDPRVIALFDDLVETLADTDDTPPPPAPTTKPPAATEPKPTAKGADVAGVGSTGKGTVSSGADPTTGGAVSIGPSSAGNGADVVGVGSTGKGTVAGSTADGNEATGAGLASDDAVVGEPGSAEGRGADGPEAAGGAGGSEGGQATASEVSEGQATGSDGGVGRRKGTSGSGGSAGSDREPVEASLFDVDQLDAEVGS